MEEKRIEDVEVMQAPRREGKNRVTANVTIDYIIKHPGKRVQFFSTSDGNAKRRMIFFQTMLKERNMEDWITTITHDTIYLRNPSRRNDRQRSVVFQ